jgi:hypothetical protein
MSQKKLGFIETSGMIIHDMILTYGIDDVSKIWDLIKVYDR